MENAKITNLYNLDETIAKEYLSQCPLICNQFLVHGKGIYSGIETRTCGIGRALVEKVILPELN